MPLSDAMRDRIVADVRQNPLEEDELRRATGTRDLYFANADSEIRPNFLYLFIAPPVPPCGDLRTGAEY